MKIMKGGAGEPELEPEPEQGEEMEARQVPANDHRVVVLRTERSGIAFEGEIRDRLRAA